MAFHVGQKVVCIADCNGSVPVHTIKRGDVLTIREIQADCLRQSGVTMGGLRFIEIVNEATPTYFGMFEADYDPDKFRPLRTTSIEVFRQMLVNPPKVTEHA